jgi:TolB-like protein/class 3 adenylate cyclase
LILRVTADHLWYPSAIPMTASAEPIERKLAAIFAADVAGYSRLMGQDEVETLRTLASHREIMDRLIAEHRGRIANTAGDSVLAEFPSVVDAVQCAVEVQRVLAEANEEVPEERRMSFRIGVHVGDVMVRGADILGDGVNVAARLQTLADPGGVCVSGEAHQYARKVLPLGYEDLGDQAVRNIEEPIKAYALKLTTSAQAQPLTTGAKPLPLPEKPSIAVLPFANLSGDPEQEYFADGVVEDVITALSRFRGLFVIARNSSFTYKGRSVDIKQVGRELGVRYVLEGSLRKVGTRVRVAAQLIEAGQGGHVWADRFEGSLDDIFALQDQVTAGVVGAIYPELERAEIDRSNRTRTDDMRAYDYYLRGISILRRTFDQSGDEALELFKKSFALDPAFAAAYGATIFCYARRKASSRTASLAWEKAEVVRLVKKVEEVGRNDAVALVSAGWGLAYVVGDARAGAALLDRALRLNPNYAQGWQFRAWTFVWLGDSEAAIEHATKAMRLSPLDPTLSNTLSAIAHAQFHAGRYEDAIEWAERSLREQSDDVPAARIYAAANAYAGKTAEALVAMQRVRELAPALRLSNLHETLGPYPPDRYERYADALRKAGLPE